MTKPDRQTLRTALRILRDPDIGDFNARHAVAGMLTLVVEHDALLKTVQAECLAGVREVEQSRRDVP